MRYLALCLSLLAFSANASRAGFSFTYNYPEVVDYSPGGGAPDEVFLVVAYTVENKGPEVEWNTLHWVVLSDGGRQIEENPSAVMVLAKYCQPHRCNPDLSLSPRRQMVPGAKLEALALIGPVSSAPDSIRLMAIESTGRALNRSCKRTDHAYNCSPAPAGRSAPEKKSKAKK